MIASKTGNGVKCKRSIRLSESWGKNPKRVWWNDEIKAAVRGKEAAWKGVLAASNEETRERYMEASIVEKRHVKICITQSKKKVNEQFRRKMNDDVNGNCSGRR